MLQTGNTIGKYKLGRRLGEGAFGLVFIAHDIGLDRDVALKFLRPHHTSNPQVLERFLQEARSAAKLAHPGIVTVYELGTVSEVTSNVGDSTAFIAMEFLTGESLGDRLKRIRRFAPDRASEICRQVASALQVAHRAGVIHRDLKPDNLFLAVDPTMPGCERVKILDFGIAKLAHAQISNVQTGSMILGTPRYMSPEQCRSSASVDHRSDIYSLGCILFELVCGRPPFEGETGELIAKHQLAAVPSVRDSVPDLPSDLDQLVSRMLAKNPDHRPQTMERVQAMLSTSDHPGLARISPLATVETDPTTPVPLSIDGPTTLSGSTGSSSVSTRARRTHVLVIATIVLAGIAAVFLVIIRGPELPAMAPPVAAELPHALEAVPPDAPFRFTGTLIVDAGPTELEQTEPSSAARHLTPDNIVAAIRGEYAIGLQRCYERYMTGHRNAPRMLVVTLRVALTGRVAEYETMPPMKNCEVFANMRFPPDAAADDPSHRVDVKVSFAYPAVPARSGVVTPAHATHGCAAGTVWKPSEAACVAIPAADKKKCLPIKDGVIDPFEKDSCRP